MSSITVHSFYRIPVLSATKRLEHITLPAGRYELKEILNPFPEYSKNPQEVPKWWVTEYEGQTVGMTLEAWITLNMDGVPFVRIESCNAYPSLKKDSPCLGPQKA